MKEGRKPEYPGKKPLATSFRKCHILKPEDSSPKRDSNPHSKHWWQARKTDMLTVTPRVAPVVIISRCLKSVDTLLSHFYVPVSTMLWNANKIIDVRLWRPFQSLTMHWYNFALNCWTRPENQPTNQPKDKQYQKQNLKLSFEILFARPCHICFGKVLNATMLNRKCMIFLRVPLSVSEATPGHHCHQ